MIIHTRLSRKFFYYAVKYAQFIHDTIPVRELLDQNGLPCTLYQLINNSKPNVRHYHVFGCPAIFKRFEISDSGKRVKNKYIQQGIIEEFLLVSQKIHQGGCSMFLVQERHTYP